MFTLAGDGEGLGFGAGELLLIVGTGGFEQKPEVALATKGRKNTIMFYQHCHGRMDPSSSNHLIKVIFK